MLIRFPFLFDAVYNENGQEARRYAGDWAEAEINEVDAEDAPLLCGVSGHSSDGMPYKFDIRKMGKTFYRPMMSVPHERYQPMWDGSDLLAPDDLAELSPLHRTRFFRPGGRQADDRYDEIVEYVRSAAERPEPVRHSRDEFLLAHRNAAAALVIVDGRVWEPCDEPRLAIALLDRRPEVVVTFPGPGQRGASWQCVLPVNRVDLAYEMLAEAENNPRILNQDLRGTRDPWQWSASDIEIPTVKSYSPSLSADPGEELVTSAKNAFVGLTLSSKLENRSKRFIHAWVDFRDMLEGLRRKPTRDDLQGVVSTWQATYEVFTDEALAAGGGSRENEANIIRARYELAAWTSALDDYVPRAQHAKTPRRNTEPSA